MKLLDRAVMFLLAALVAAAGVGLIFCGLQRQTALTFFADILNGPASYGWALLLIGVVLIFIGLVIIIGIACRPNTTNHTRTQTVVTTAEGGNVQMSINAVDSIIKRAASTVAGVGEPKSEIRTSEAGVSVHIKVPVIADVNIPETINVLHSTVQHYLENLAGLKVAEIQVLVTEVHETAAV